MTKIVTSEMSVHHTLTSSELIYIIITCFMLIYNCDRYFGTKYFVKILNGHGLLNTHVPELIDLRVKYFYNDELKDRPRSRIRRKPLHFRGPSTSCVRKTLLGGLTIPEVQRIRMLATDGRIKQIRLCLKIMDATIVSA